ncbi:MAG: fumarylacetoacetate hydrolase family protein [Acidobacteriota bacterium]
MFSQGRFIQLGAGWDQLIARDDLPEFLHGLDWDDARQGSPRELERELLPPVEGQEVWAAGVTYLRSREARMEESAHAGGGDFYDRVYGAPRPELFLKSPGWRARGHLQPVRIRGDAAWSVPEPELTLVVSAGGRITGYTIGNDMCSRDIEGENPLYLPQAKIYDGSCAVGPGIYVTAHPLPPETEIRLTILRDGPVFDESVTLARMKRSGEELVSYLYRELTFPLGCLLMTGTGIVPPADFTLAPGDRVRICIDPIGTLENPVETGQFTGKRSGEGM